MFLFNLSLTFRDNRTPYGACQVIVEAKDAEDAETKVRDHLRELASPDRLLPKLQRVYIDSLIQISEVPTAPLVVGVTFFNKMPTPGLNGILPKDAEGHAVAYSQHPAADGTWDDVPLLDLTDSEE